MLIKKYAALFFCLCLVALLFYGGINLAEQGTKDLLGVDEPPRALRIYSRGGGELEIFWSGSSRVVSIAFIFERAARARESLQSIISGRGGRGSQEEGKEGP